MAAAKAILAGNLPPGSPASNLDLEELVWPGFAFEPQRELSVWSYCGRPHLWHTVAEEASPEDAVALAREKLSPRGEEVYRAVLAAAMVEAANVLANLSGANSDDKTPHRNNRLCARLCQAAREELAELLREWHDLAGVKVQA